MSKSNKVIVIVGGGIAGISALKNLLENGFNHAFVLEAQSIVGGRIKTKAYGDHVIEIGAQWIHGEDGNPLHKLAKSHDLIQATPKYSTFSDNVDDYFYSSKGKRISENLAEKTCDLIDKIFDGASKFSRKKSKKLGDQHESMGTYTRREFDKYLTSCGKHEHDKQLMEGIFQWRCLLEKSDNACSSVFDLSLYAWGEYEECAGNAYVPLKHGFRKVIEHLCKNIPVEAIKLNEPVKNIHWNSSKPVVVTTASGDVIQADHVIVTCSLGYLKKHSPSLFTPSLPDAKLSAITRLGFGTVDKIYLEFDKPFWGKRCAGIQFVWLKDDDFTLKSSPSNPGQKQFDWWRELHGFDTVEFQPNLLCGWIASQHADVMETISDDVIMNVCHELLLRFTNRQDIPKPIRVTRSHWHGDEYTLGSYTFITTDSSTSDCDQLAQPLPSSQDPRLLFAGEATHSSYFSTTHAAYISGQREAQRIIDHYK